MGAGPWHHLGMAGYTSAGAGTSLLPVRLNCPPEITLHTFRRLRQAPAAAWCMWQPATRPRSQPKFSSAFRSKIRFLPGGLDGCVIPISLIINCFLQTACSAVMSDQIRERMDAAVIRQGGATPAQMTSR
jgi:hypothetical protein